MALLLNVEQKNLSNLFTGREQFVIPSYFLTVLIDVI